MSLVMVMAGGTGGHIFPALAVASELRDRGVDVVWLGTQNGMEARVVPQAGFPIEWISIRGLRGKGALGWLVSPVRILKAIVQSLSVLRKLRPVSVLGMGGFVAGPGGVSAKLLGIPLIIHEQNAAVGLTNKLLSRLANSVLSGFPKVEGLAKNFSWVGNPVRKFASSARVGDSPSRCPRVLITGGSQGALKINQLMPEAFAFMASKELAELGGELAINGEGNQAFEVWHQTGANKKADVSMAYQRAGVAARVDEFIEDMGDAYEWADIVVARAGAMTVTEIAAAGLPSILIPFPHAVGDHQTANANFLSRADAALICQEVETNAEDLAKTLYGLLGDRERMTKMGDRAAGLYKSDSASVIADVCMEAGHA
ncbi:MAG TPA: undecaprenyldiphospho-muramoylpentapeptide beta-N-acetylglucosaminyltransferase [Gammaproteobacteria bacterium]|jgi:UDP-N-acetylglucosamine--N-acetylmuramyl-(pentapeptide) pyrophosphoryl-undecaprenol N-acetylglucosamine transferase|nr:undecaprenyldiphospho-muramoylpentapeptide beta-N-acetylglucosaminyltransferase [Pseudomonadota bacterium]HAY45593.1 undecaprenyldiphospho-muramoylpentapeptide beta-N-acetylglucosaminyltransferase [Gammaproteobacteria bacterium]